MGGLLPACKSVQVMRSCKKLIIGPRECHKLGWVFRALAKQLQGWMGSKKGRMAVCGISAILSGRIAWHDHSLVE